MTTRHERCSVFTRALPMSVQQFTPPRRGPDRVTSVLEDIHARISRDNRGEKGDGGGFNGIGVRWIARFMKDRGEQATFEPWLQKNAEAAWQARRVPDNLSWCRWPQPTPEDKRFSWGCSSAVVSPCPSSTLPVAIETAFQQALYNSVAAEVAARRTAMESATDNATELIARVNAIRAALPAAPAM